VYVRIPDKGILRGDDDDTSENGISNVLSKNNHDLSYKIWKWRLIMGGEMVFSS
jgi:hypothetical protein